MQHENRKNMQYDNFEEYAENLDWHILSKSFARERSRFLDTAIVGLTIRCINVL